jgi:hypothetical protein
VVKPENFPEEWGRENAAIYVKIERTQAHPERQTVTVSLQWSLVYRYFLSVSITILLEENGELVGHSFS